MIKEIIIDGQEAVITYDLETKLFRGQFVGLNGAADFFSIDIAGLEAEGRASLNLFLDACKENCADSFKSSLMALRNNFDRRLSVLRASDAGDRLRAVFRGGAKLCGKLKVGND